MATPYPDYRTYTTRDYGNRVGVFRIFRVLDALGVKASAVMNSAVAERYPSLLAEVQRRGWEVTAHGRDMNAIHYGGMDEAAERAQIGDSLAAFKSAGAGPVGWFSPGRGESENTLKLLAEAGVDYVGDWVNDDMPYRMETEAGSLISMPMTTELDDRQIFVTLGHREETYAEQVLDAYRLFDREAQSYGGRILQVMLTPYVIGQPFRIQALREALAPIVSEKSVWVATGEEILRAWTAQQ
ncbi:MAG: polysaccharide deacetylase family protein [Pseudomonadota bacterium]